MAYMDLHCDTLQVFAGVGGSLYENHMAVDVKRLRRAGCLAQFFAVWLPDPETKDRLLGRKYRETGPESGASYGAGTEKSELSKSKSENEDRRSSNLSCGPEPGAEIRPELLEELSNEEWDDRYFDLLTDSFYETIREHGEKLAFAGNGTDLLENRKAGKLSAFLSLEDGRLVRGSHERLRHLYDKGVRLITLTWNHDNCFGRANYREEPFGNRESGLTAFGKEAVTQMEALGILTDVSHLSDEGFFDAADCIRGPFVASHSNARALCNCSRNLTDEMLHILGDHGGAAGLNFAPSFLRENSLESRVSDLARHAAHMVKKGGEEVLCLGTDFDGIGGDLEIDGPEKMALLWDALKRAGFTERQIELVQWGNAQRVIREALK